MHKIKLAEKRSSGGTMVRMIDIKGFWLFFTSELLP
jgi:hypothetical protein